MRLSRRQLLRGTTAGSAHIASLVVQCLPRNLDSTRSAIEALDGAEVPETDERGKMVVLLECHSEGALLDTIRDIEHTSGVISANMVFHQLDEEEGS